MALKTITIDDFSGGRTNFLDQRMIPNNMCASGSQNVWAPEGALIKTPGYTSAAQFTATGGLNTFATFYIDDSVNANNQIFYRINVSSTGNGSAAYFLWGSSTTLTNTLSLLGYTTGTVSVSGANLISATGNGTSWLNNIQASDLMVVSGATNGYYAVSSVEDNTHLTLQSALPAAVATGTSYTISPGASFYEIAYASLNGNLCSVTTGDLMHNYSSTGSVRITAAPKAAYLAVYQNYMFAARTNTAESRLYWSASKDPTSWPASNFVDIDVRYGKITGMFALGQELLIFKTRAMYKVLGTVFDPSNPQYQVLRINTPNDFIFNSNQSVAVHNIGSTDLYGRSAVIFYANGRIYKYITGTMFITDISLNIIRDLPTSFGNYNDAMANSDQRIKAISFNGNYIIKGMTDTNTPGGENGLCLILDKKGAWWNLRNDNATETNSIFVAGSFIVIPINTGRPQIATHNSASGRVYAWDIVSSGYSAAYASVNSSTGAMTQYAINAVWVSKEFNIEYGTFKWLVIYLLKQSAGNLTVKWSIDQGASVSNTVDMTVGRGQVIRAVLPIQQKGSTIQITLSNNTINQTFRIFGIKIFYEESLGERLL